MVVLGELFILFALIALAVRIFIKVLGSVVANVTALVADGIALIVVYVIVASNCTANVAIAIALIVIDVRVNKANIFATFYVTSGITSVVENVRINVVTNVSATFNVAGNIAGIAVNVRRNFTNVVTIDNVTNCITYATVLVRRNLAGSTANVTSCIALVAINVILNRRCTGFLANVTGCIASIAICMLYCANVSATFDITGGITSIIECVGNFANESTLITIDITLVCPSVYNVATGFTAEVTIGIAITAIRVFKLAHIVTQVTRLVAQTKVFVRRNACQSANVTFVITGGFPSMFGCCAVEAAGVTHCIAFTAPSVFGCAFSTANVALGIASIVVFMRYCTFNAAIVALGIATIIVYVRRHFACVPATLLYIAFFPSGVTSSVTIIAIGVLDFTVILTVFVVTSGVTITAVLVCCLAFVAATGGITKSIATIIPNVIYLANSTTKVTSGITNAAVNVLVIILGVVICFGKRLATVVSANITCGIANIAIDMGHRSNVNFTTTLGCTQFRTSIGEFVRNLASVVTLVTIGVAIVIPIVRSYTFVFTEVTNSIAIIIIYVCLTVATNVSANVTNGIASITECQCGIGDMQGLACVITSIQFTVYISPLGGVTNGVARMIKSFLGIGFVQRFASVRAIRLFAVYTNFNYNVTRCITRAGESRFGIANVQRFASEIATNRITIGIAIVIKIVAGKFTRKTTAFYVTGGVAITGPLVTCGAGISTTGDITNIITIMRPFVISNGGLANESTTGNVTGGIAIATILVRVDFTGEVTTFGVTIGVTKTAEFVIGMKRPSSDEVHIIGYGSGLIPFGAVFKFPTGKGISALGGVFQICKSFAACYFNGVQVASAGRIEGYGLGIKEHQNSCKCKRN